MGMKGRKVALSDDEIQVRWQANFDAVQAAKAAYRNALRARAKIETACGQSARRRNPAHPILNTLEVERVQAARDSMTAAHEALVDAQAQFKAGVV